MTDTYRYALKCMACGCHYNVYSWYDTWLKEHMPFCPECGKQKTLSLGWEMLKGRDIYEFVGAV